MSGQENVAAGGFQFFLGDELRRAREAAGKSRDDVRTRLSSQITDRTVYGYERGETGFSVARFVDICEAIGVDAPTVLELALQRAQQDTQTLHIDLRAVLNDENIELLAVRQWAQNRMSDDPTATGTARVPTNAVPEMAAVIGCSPQTLLTYLSSFPPYSASV